MEDGRMERLEQSKKGNTRAERDGDMNVAIKRFVRMHVYVRMHMRECALAQVCVHTRT